MENLDPAIQKRIEESWARQKLMSLYEAKITGTGRGYFEATVQAKEALLRTNGIFHGGVIAAMADSAGGYSAGTMHENDASFLTIEFKVNFLRQARGEKLIARATVLKGGQTITVSRVDVFVENDTLVATAIVTLIKEK